MWSRIMFGDANSWSAFSRPTAVIWGCVLVALVATLALYPLGNPIWASLPVFIVVFIGCLLVARPMIENAEPVFDFIDEEP